MAQILALGTKSRKLNNYHLNEIIRPSQTLPQIQYYMKRQSTLKLIVTLLKRNSCLRKYLQTLSILTSTGRYIH